MVLGPKKTWAFAHVSPGWVVSLSDRTKEVYPTRPVSAPSRSCLSATENLLQLHGHWYVELRVGARCRIAVGAPVHEACGVAEAVALEVLVRHFGDQLDTDRLPAQILAAGPATLGARPALRRIAGISFCPPAPRVFVERAGAVRRQLLQQLFADRRGKAAGDAHMVEHTVAVEQPEQQRPNSPLLVLAIAADRTVGGALMLHLQHSALTLAVLVILALGHDAVEPRPLETLEPFLGQGAVGGRGREQHRRFRRLQRALQPLPTVAERRAAKIVAAFRQQIEGHERGGRVGRQL